MNTDEWYEEPLPDPSPEEWEAKCDADVERQEAKRDRIAEDLDRQNDFFRRYTDKGINPFEPTEG